jgi:hypothetical protein
VDDEQLSTDEVDVDLDAGDADLEGATDGAESVLRLVGTGAPVS